MTNSYAFPMNGSAVQTLLAHDTSSPLRQHRKAQSGRFPTMTSSSSVLSVDRVKENGHTAEEREAHGNHGHQSERRHNRSHPLAFHHHSYSLPNNHLASIRPDRPPIPPDPMPSTPRLQVQDHDQPDLGPQDVNTDLPEDFTNVNHNFPQISPRMAEQPTAPSMLMNFSNRISWKELATALLIVGSYVVLDILLSGQWIGATVDVRNANESIRNVYLDATPKPAVLQQNKPSLALMCLLSSSTLLLAGILGEIQAVSNTPRSRRRAATLVRETEQPSRKPLTKSYSLTSKKIGGRMLGVGLPFYTASKLGSTWTGVLFLAAAASNVLDLNEPSESEMSRLPARLLRHKWVAIALAASICLRAATWTSSIGSVVLGYFAFIISITLIPPPFPASTIKRSAATSQMTSSEFKTTSLATPLGGLKSASEAIDPSRKTSPLASTPTELLLTIISGGIMAVLSAALLVFCPSTSADVTLFTLLGSVPFTLPLAASLIYADISSLQRPFKFGAGLGMASLVLFTGIYSMTDLGFLGLQGAMASFLWLGLRLDTPSADVVSYSNSSHRLFHSHGHHARYGHNSDHHHVLRSHSIFTRWLLSKVEDISLLHSILIEKDSRRIFYFMNLNLGFMLIQTFYGVVTGSLGLLSDSIHMFFDCVALVVGMCAAVMSKWPPSQVFPHGYGKMDCLAGLGNGLFLMLISIEIIYEAIERLVEGAKMQRIGELMIVSGFGLIVNIVGLMSFGHAHAGHGHGHFHEDHSQSHSHSHSHSHHLHAHSRGHQHNSHGANHLHRHHSEPNHPRSNLSQVLKPPSSPFDAEDTQSIDFPSILPTPDPNLQTMSDADSRHHPQALHHHPNENMHGIFLHVLADTLGSVAVVFSTIAVHYTGWSGWDPIASVLIAILIFVSAIPLCKSSASQLLLTIPEASEFDLREALVGIQELRGVVGVTVPKFWMRDHENEARFGGVMHIVAMRTADLDDVRVRSTAYLGARGMDVTFQVEREGEGRCWCGGSVKN